MNLDKVDRLARLLAFQYAYPPVKSERAWLNTTVQQKAHWKDDAKMILAYLEVDDDKPVV